MPHHENNPAIYVGPAHHGKGVFAAVPLVGDAVVGHVVGKFIRDSNYSSDYCIAVGDDYTLDPAAPFRFLNHSCEPNCQFTWEPGPGKSPRSRPRVYLETLRDIEPHEELTIDYAWPVETAIPCGCGSPQCRGWIVAADEVGHLKRAGKSRPA